MFESPLTLFRFLLCDLLICQVFRIQLTISCSKRITYKNVSSILMHRSFNPRTNAKIALSETKCIQLINYAFVFDRSSSPTKYDN